jgi:hypothetical protein
MEHELHTMIANLQTEVARQGDLIRMLQLKQSSTKPKPVLQDPEKFTGQPHKFDTWLPSIKAKLRVDGEAIGDSVAQFYYVYLDLESNVQAMVLPQLSQAEELESWNYNTILEQLSRVNFNPNKIQEAEDKLLALKQGTDSLPAYVAKFERILYEAKGQNWPDVNKISTFRSGLNSIIRARLSQQLNLPPTYPEFVRVVQQLAGKSIPQPQAPTSGNGSGYRSEPMDTSIGSINSISPGCVRCRSQDHSFLDCPRRPNISENLVVDASESDSDTSVSEEADYPTHLDWRKCL